jgi:hypothetical protein
MKNTPRTLGVKQDYSTLGIQLNNILEPVLEQPSRRE